MPTIGPRARLLRVRVALASLAVASGLRFARSCVDTLDLLRRRGVRKRAMQRLLHRASGPKPGRRHGDVHLHDFHGSRTQHHGRRQRVFRQRDALLVGLQGTFDRKPGSVGE